MIDLDHENIQILVLTTGVDQRSLSYSDLRTKILNSYQSNCSETRYILRPKTLRVFNSDIANIIFGPLGIMFIVSD